MRTARSSVRIATDNQIMNFSKGPSVVSTAPDTPNEAIELLLAGNRRYVEGTCCASNPPEARSSLAEGQSPYAGIIRCVDSRVAPEIVFDQPLGSLMVCGVAGNIPTIEVIASMEYGVAVLGMKLVVVMGHGCCGMVDAAMRHRSDPDALPGSLPGLARQVALPDPCECDPEDPVSRRRAETHNANHGVSLILERSPLISAAVESGAVRVIAGVEDLESGVFSITRD